jgi:hypothetical protein
LGSVSLSAPASVADGGEDERENDPIDEDEEEEQDPHAQLLARAVPGANEEDIEWALTGLHFRQAHGEIRSITAYLRTLIKNGDAKALVGEAAAERRRAEIDDARYEAAHGYVPDPFGAAPQYVAPNGPVVRGEVISEDAADAVRMADEVRALGPDVTDEEASAAAVILAQDDGHTAGSALKLARKQIETESAREATVRTAHAKLISDTRAKLDEIRVSAWREN